MMTKEREIGIKIRNAMIQFSEYCVREADRLQAIMDGFEEKPLIVRSGHGWVVSNFGINYLFLGYGITDIDLITTLFKSYNKEENELFKRFSVIKKEGLTNDIAKLSPMVITEVLSSCHPSKLISVENAADVCGEEIKGTFYNCVYNNNIYTVCEVRLATPHELQESDDGKK